MGVLLDDLTVRDLLILGAVLKVASPENLP